LDNYLKAMRIPGDTDQIIPKQFLKRIERTGFTKYQRVGKGQYERRTGTFGPKQISAD
jgi:3-isopropylmalate dehydratase small subunit